jgi:hypothetical protein
MFSTSTFKTILLAIALMPPLWAQAGNLRRRLQTDSEGQCAAVPLRIRSDGRAVESGTFYVALIQTAFENPLDLFNLCDALIASYNGGTDCSALNGSFREVGSCDVITDAAGPPGGLLLKLEYFANVVDGDDIFGDDAASACECNCGGSSSQASSIGVFLDDACNCYCDATAFDCSCPAPTQEGVVSGMNEIYPTLNGDLSDPGRFVAVYQLEKLDVKACNVDFTTFNTTSLCPGLQSAAFANELTAFPSVTPPSNMPSEFPSEFPTGKDLKKNTVFCFVWLLPLRRIRHSNIQGVDMRSD